MSWKDSTFGRMFWWHKRKVVETTVGWNPDPQGDGDKWERKDKGTPSGTVEYSRPARKPFTGDIHREWDDTDQ